MFDKIATQIAFLRSLDYEHGNPQHAVQLSLDNIEREIAYVERDVQRLEEENERVKVAQKALVVA